MGIGSIWHWLILLLVVVLVFGTGKLRNAGKDLGAAVHEFKEGLKGKQKTDSAPAADKDETTGKDS